MCGPRSGPAMTARVWPVRMRQASSRDCTSRMQCRLFSTSRCPRTSSAKAVASTARLECSGAPSVASDRRDRCVPPAPGPRRGVCYPLAEVSCLWSEGTPLGVVERRLHLLVEGARVALDCQDVVGPGFPQGLHDGHLAAGKGP